MNTRSTLPCGSPAPAIRSSKTWKTSRRFTAEAKNLGKRIRTLRLEEGLTLDQASKRMDVDLRHLQKVEAGTLNVTLVTLVRIAWGLGKPFAALCGFYATAKPKRAARVARA